MGQLEYQQLDGKSNAKRRLQRIKAFYKRIKALSPISYLARARDYSVRSMTEWSGMAGYVDIVAAPGVAMAAPMSHSLHSSSYRDRDNNYIDLMRATSQRERATTTPTRRTTLSDHDQPLPRSFSTPTGHYHQQQLGVERIDEEGPCHFSASFKKTADEDLFLRSRSYSAVQNMNLHGRRNANVV